MNAKKTPQNGAIESIKKTAPFKLDWMISSQHFKAHQQHQPHEQKHRAIGQSRHRLHTAICYSALKIEKPT
jgi:hypothetical protein